MMAHRYLKDLFELGMEGAYDKKSRTSANPGGAKFWPKPNWLNSGINFLNEKFGKVLREFDGYLWAFNRLSIEDGLPVLMTGKGGKKFPHRRNSGILLYPRDPETCKVQEFKERFLEDFPQLNQRVITGQDLIDVGLYDIVQPVSQLRSPGSLDEYDRLVVAHTLFLCVPAMNADNENAYWSNQIQRNRETQMDSFVPEDSDSTFEF